MLNPEEKLRRAKLAAAELVASGRAQKIGSPMTEHPGAGGELLALARAACVALCLTMGVFAIDYALRHGRGWWLPVVLLVPPLTIIALRARASMEQSNGE